MSFRAWLSLVTVVLLAIILFASREELLSAWEMLSRVNPWILALMIPLQVLVYYSGGEMIFSYLRGKGHMKKTKRWELAKIALEGNFVNHVLPSGGVSGVSYLSWRLNLLGVGAGRATMAQVVRHVMAFIAFLALLLVALFAVTVDGTINRWIILASAGLFGGIFLVILVLVYILSSKRRIDIFTNWLFVTCNAVVRRVTFGRKIQLLQYNAIRDFLNDMHVDFLALKHDKKLLGVPFLWGLIYTIGDAGLFLIAFWSLGEVFNPAPILIAYGMASVAGFVVLTPGGAGVYEAIMVTFLAFAGIASDVAIAGILLARVVILIGTIAFGYVFYQYALTKYGGGDNGPKVKR
ncbi:flippase-like domain-containing protein [Candidatus Saccharibacteria bacterium]|nr:flippase-like domain-containing protein [Candidatus Saccharibacteria bacterium]